MKVSLEAAEITKYYWEEYFKNISVDSITNETIKREIVALKILGNSALEADKLETVYIKKMYLGILSFALITADNFSECNAKYLCSCKDMSI